MIRKFFSDMFWRRKRKQSNLTVGKGTYGIEHIKILTWRSCDRRMCTIGNYCSISANLKIFLGGNHNLNWATTFPFGHVNTKIINVPPVKGHPVEEKDVVIGSDVWIGRDVTIMPGVQIGHGAVVAANSHVVRDVKPYEVVGGNPAVHLKFRFNQSIVEKLVDAAWWELPEDDISGLVSKLTSEINDDNIVEFCDMVMAKKKRKARDK